MIVCLVARRIWTHGLGGMEEQCRNLAIELVRQGHPVHILTTAHPGGHQQERLYGATVHYLTGTPPGDYSPAWWHESRRWARDYFTALGVDAVLSMSMAAYGLIGIDRPPLHTLIVGWGLNQLRSYWHDARHWRGLVKFPRSALSVVVSLPRAQALLRASRSVLAASEDIQRQLHRYGARLVPNSIDTTTFARDQAARDHVRRRLCLSDADCLMLMVSTVTWQKGVHLGLRACGDVARDHPNVAALVVGDGPAAAEIEGETRRRMPHLRTFFTGAQPHDDVAAFYAAADVFLMPSLRQEAMPTTTMLEAMACSLPIVTMRPGKGSVGVIHGESGLVVPLGDVRSFTAAVRSLMAHPRQREIMGQAARAHAAAAFDRAVVVRRLVEILEGGAC